MDVSNEDTVPEEEPTSLSVQPEISNPVSPEKQIFVVSTNAIFDPISDLPSVSVETANSIDINITEPEENPESLAKKYAGKLVKTYNSFVNNFFLFQEDRRNNQILVQKFSDVENSFIEKEVKEFENVVLQSLKIDVDQMLQSYISKRYGSASKELIETITKMNDDFIKQHEVFALKIASKMAEYAKLSIEKEYKHPAQQRVIERMIIHLEKLLANFELLQRKTLKNMTINFGDISLKKQDEQ